MRWLACLLVACSSPSPPAVEHAPTYDHDRDAIPIVDSHVHLAYYPVAEQLAEHHVRAVVDLAAPESAMSTRYPIQVIQSGPMLTRPGGYPLDAWGADGYGIGCDSIECVESTIDRLAKEGAGVIKIALDDDGLPPRLALAASLRAHKLGLKVVVHALSDAGVSVAAGILADILAHTPTEPLSDETIDSWKHVNCGRTCAVITTLAAFGGSPTAIDNLRRLRAAGFTVLYGTDLGNLRVDGPSAEEMALMRRAGMTEGQVIDAMTTVPWHFWGFDARGPIPGRPAVEPTR